MSGEREQITRRKAVVAGIAGAAGVAAIGAVSGTKGEATDEQRSVAGSPGRMPVAFIPHGGGPWPFVELGIGKKEELASLTEYLLSLRALTPSRPKALLVVSAHWEEPVPTVMTSPNPPMLYDYYGFPPESYTITYPAPGAPSLGGRVRKLLSAAGIPTAEDPARGFDHGTFVPIKLTYPEADIPVLQLSLKRGLDPTEHLAIGRAIAPLRDEGVFIIGSGMSYHNLGAFNASAKSVSETFDAWLGDAATAEATTRDEKLREWASAPEARKVHPREEHLLPLMVIAGAAGADRGTRAFSGTIFDLRISAFHYGVVANT